MLISAGFRIDFTVAAETPMLLMLSVHPSREADLVDRGALRSTPALPLASYHDTFGNLVHRITLPPGTTTVHDAFTIRDDGAPDERNPAAQQWPVQRVPHDVLPFLLASRYCDIEALNPLAWSLFGRTPLGWARVQAICDYVHERIAFGYQHARNTRTASEANYERTGVCRDFAHLAVTLCRCMNIPARYCTGYLGDIGVPLDPNPMDFSAWFQAYLDGRWYTFDARHNKPRIGRILMATGRDAVDVAISTGFGFAQLDRFEVTTLEVAEAPRTAELMGGGR